MRTSRLTMNSIASRTQTPHVARCQHRRAPCAAPACFSGRQQAAECRHRLSDPAAHNVSTRRQFVCRAEPEAADEPLPNAEPNGGGAAPLGPRDDDVLPDSLTDAISQASASTITAMQSGSNRIVAEVLLGEFWDPSSGAIFAEEGDQQRFWKLTKRFTQDLATAAGPGTTVRALYPDMGVAAMLKNQWTDVDFAIGSLSDRTPFLPDDDIVVFAAPDPQGVAAAKRITADAEDKTVVMFNPRLTSAEVGIGLNVRRLVNDFLGSFTVAYSLRPIGDIGTVYRRYPEPWKVFIEDEGLQGRYRLAAERDSRPAGEALDFIISDALGVQQENGEGGAGFGQQILSTIKSLQRFSKSLTR